MQHHRLVLASASPRRRDLLARLGVAFDVVPSDVDESFNPKSLPATIAAELSIRKAASIAPRFPDRLILAADTIVVLDGQILNKPADAEDAIGMLQQLSGGCHDVYTGIALVQQSSDRSASAIQRTRVTFDELEMGEIEAYVAGGSPLDKAGAYGIQDDRGALFVKRVEGDYYNVVGLPLNLLYRTVKQHFPDLNVFA